MRSIMTFAAFALAAAVIVPRYAGQVHLGQTAPTLMAAQPASQTASTANSRSVVLSPNGQGHFQVEARIDGRRLTFMVDTGASVIALHRARRGDARHPSDAEGFTATVRTANGIVRAAPVELTMVEIDDISAA